MPVVKLDANFALTATCPPGRQKIDYYDQIVSGFILEVRSTGSKTYSLRYRDSHDRQRQFKIGNAADLSFDRAKKEAIKVRARVTTGDNPAEEKQVKRTIVSVKQLADRYLEHVRSYKRSPDIDERYLRNHIVPKFGHLRLDEVMQADVVTWLASKVKVEGYAPATVNRLHVVISYMFKLAKRWSMPGAEINPLQGVSLLKMNNQLERFLSPEETRRLRDAVDASENTQLRFIVALLLLTGARKRELLDARWEDFDIDRRSWRIPMSKSGKARHVPLSAAAIEVIGQLRRFPECAFLVPNPKTRKPYVSIFFCWNKARIEAGLPDVRIHDLRHSAASNMVNSGQSLYVVAKVLGHAQMTTSQRYAHLSNDTLLAAVNAGADVMGTDWAEPRQATG